MKNIALSILVALMTPMCLFTSCDREIMDYEGPAAIYFDQQYGWQYWGTLDTYAHQIYSLVSFGSMDKTDSILPVKVCISGHVVDYDRPFQVEVVKDSTTAIEGEEFELLDKDCTIKAGENLTYVKVALHKSERMSDMTPQIQIKLIPGSNFTTDFSRIGNIPMRWKDTNTEYSKNEDPTVHNIFVNNILQKPGPWNVVQFGNYSRKKHALLIEVAERELGLPKSAFEETNKMQQGRTVLIARVASAYLKQKYNEGRENWIIDEDGTMMWINGVSWAQNTKPEDMQGK